MLEELFRKIHPKYRSLPILGPTLDEFAGWLIERGYRLTDDALDASGVDIDGR